MVTGDDVQPVDTTESWASGLAVDQIACRNLEMGLRPATSAANARPCQQIAMAQPTTTTITQTQTTLPPVFVIRLTAAVAVPGLRRWRAWRGWCRSRLIGGCERHVGLEHGGPRAAGGAGRASMSVPLAVP